MLNLLLSFHRYLQINTETSNNDKSSERKCLGVDGLIVPGDSSVIELSLEDDEERRIHFTFSGNDTKAILIPDSHESQEENVSV